MSYAWPSTSKASGQGLEVACVRQLATFTIEAHSEDGQRLKEGGDAFFVAIRSRGTRVRAKVIDEYDGTYTVEYRPTVSGSYSIAISLYGEELPGSPFAVIIGTPTPCPEQCELRGKALTEATARAPQHFEVLFRDAIGQTAHAEDLDVHIEPISASKDDDDAIPKMGFLGEEGEERSSSPPPEEGSSPPPPQQNIRPGEVVVVGKKPLVVRRKPDLESERMGQLQPGQMVTILEFSEAAMSSDEGGSSGDGDLRARVAYQEEVSASEDDELRVLTSHSETWRAFNVTRPIWLEETPRATSPTQRVSAPGGSPLKAAKFVSPALSSRRVTEPGPSCSRAKPSTRLTPVGWVTIQKGGRLLVAPHRQLQAGERQRSMQQWARRLAVDKTLAVASLKDDGEAGGGKKAGGAVVAGKGKGGGGHAHAVSPSRHGQSVYLDELHSDPKGIGFAFGGVEPGRLHSHGRLHEVHKVHYSVGLCGEYHLHVGLHQSSTPLPGSPFTLVVTPGPAHALSTKMPAGAMTGTVGRGEGTGCHVLLRASDKMGNVCIAGGAAVACSSKDASVESAAVDQNDGTYMLEWHSNHSGSFEVAVTIDGMPITGSPATLKLTSSTPDLTKTEMGGGGLTKAVAGKPAEVVLRCLDQYNNSAVASDDFTCGIALLKPHIQEKGKEKETLAEKERKWKSAVSLPLESFWKDEQFTVSYVAKVAGEIELHIWVDMPDAEGKVQRQLLPGSPYLVAIGAGKANPTGSSIEGIAKEVEIIDRTNPNKGKKTGEKAAEKVTTMKVIEEVENAQVCAGDVVVIRPRIRDQYGNAAAAPDGALLVVVEEPDGTRQELEVRPEVKNGLTLYDIRFVPERQGTHLAHLALGGNAIDGSPVEFEVTSASPYASMSRIEMPTASPLLANIMYEIILYTSDKYGNTLDRGGAVVTGRLTGASLPHGQETAMPVVDRGDGSYAIQVTMRGTAETKVAITLDKDRAGFPGGGEFPLMPMSFIRPPLASKEGDEEGDEKKDEKGKDDKGRARRGSFSKLVSTPWDNNLTPKEAAAKMAAMEARMAERRNSFTGKSPQSRRPNGDGSRSTSPSPGASPPAERPPLTPTAAAAAAAAAHAAAAAGEEDNNE